MIGGLDDSDDAGGGHLTRRPASDSPCKALQGLVLGTERVELQPHAGVLTGQLVHFLLQLCFLPFELFFLRDALDAAAGRVAAVLQRAAALFQPDHVFLGQPAQVLVELPYRHGHQLVVAECRGILTHLLL